MKFLKYITQFVLALLLLGIISTSCEKQELGNYSDDYVYSISEMIENEAQFSSFYQILLADSVARGALNAHNPYGTGYTMFLPTNEAVQSFIDETEAFNSLDDILANEEYVSALIRFHVVNTDFLTQDFPYGVLTDTTASGDYISIYYEEGDTGNYYEVQGEAIITTPNVEARNGVVHILDRMLTPVVYSGYATLEAKGGYSIFIEGLKATELTSEMEVENIVDGIARRNRYTIFAEPDTMYARYGISSFDELKEALYDTYGDANQDITDYDNPVYQFFAYHVYEGAHYTSNLFPDLNNDESTSSTILNSFGKNGMSVWANDSEIRINRGSGIYSYKVEGEDTTEITWLRIDLQTSNLVSKNGPIHKLDYILLPFSPAASTVTFEMDDEPAIDKQKELEGSYPYFDEELDELSKFTVTGNRYLSYRYGPSHNIASYASGYNYWRTYGNFSVTYTTPRVLAGTYYIALGLNAYESANATVEIYVDGEKVGTTIDLSANDGVESDDPFVEFAAGIMSFDDYSTHDITIKSITSGYLYWDYVKFYAY